MRPYPRPKTSRAHPQHRVYPYLLRNLTIHRPNQVWAADITYVPICHGFMHLVAVMDWHSRKVLAYRLPNTMETDFCVEALEEAVDRYGAPEIFNTDQGCQFTSEDFTDVVKDHGIKISMDGRRRCQDNFFIERLWWTLKYHYLYLHSFDNGAELRKALGGWFAYYNKERFHQTLDNHTPDEVYFGLPHPFAEAAGCLLYRIGPELIGYVRLSNLPGPPPIFERCFRSLKRTQIKMTPMYHWLSRRIETHVRICVLSLLIERVVELECEKPRAQIRSSLQKLQVTEFQTGDHRYFRRNEISSEVRNTLKALKINPPKAVLSIEKLSKNPS